MNFVFTPGGPTPLGWHEWVRERFTPKAGWHKLTDHERYLWALEHARCKKCGAFPGERCINLRGIGLLYNHHQERTWLASCFFKEDSLQRSSTMCDQNKPNGNGNQMFIVRKPDIVVENDKIYEKAKEASTKLVCTQAPGGHRPMAMKTDVDPNGPAGFREPWGWSFTSFKHEGERPSRYAYFCECCHMLYFVELVNGK